MYIQTQYILLLYQTVKINIALKSTKKMLMNKSQQILYTEHCTNSVYNKKYKYTLEKLHI